MGLWKEYHSSVWRKPLPKALECIPVPKLHFYKKAAPQRGGTEKVQFFSACSGAGMRPPRLTNTDGENVLTGRMGA